MICPKWICAVLFAGLTFLITCTAPNDPLNNPQNAKCQLLLINAAGKSDGSFIEDSVGNRIQIKVALFLPSLIDSIEIRFQYGQGADTAWMINGELDDTVSTDVTLIIGGSAKVVSTIFRNDGTIATDSAVVMVHSRPLFVSTLAVSPGLLAPSFSPDTLNYTVSVPSTVTQIRITAEASVGAQIKVNGNNSSAPVALNYGQTEITVRIISGAGTDTITYTIRVKRATSDLRLASLTLNTANLEPLFDPSIQVYTADLPDTQSRVVVNAVASDSTCTVLVNGKSPGSPEFIQYGLTVIPVQVTKLSDTLTYILRLTRHASDISQLRRLSIAGYRLNPDFVPDVNTGLMFLVFTG